MRATSPAIVDAISPAGEVVRKVAVAAPSGVGLPQFGLRVVKNKLAVQFRRTCDSNIDHGSCGGSIYAVFDATTGKRLAAYEAKKDVAGPVACYLADPDRFLIFSMDLEAHG
jgi:hypothetical protein